MEIDSIFTGNSFTESYILRSVELLDGNWLYVTKQNVAGLWRIPTQGGDESLVLSQLHPVDWNNWALTSNGVYFVDRAMPDRPEIAFLEFASRRITRLGGV